MIKQQCFGVEIEMTGITREQAAKAVAEYFGTGSSYIGSGYDTWQVTDNEGKAWKLMSDSSIHAEMKSGNRYISTSDSKYKVEMVTPKLTYEELPKLQEVVRVLRRAGAKVNESCGLHSRLSLVCTLSRIDRGSRSFSVRRHPVHQKDHPHP